MFKKKDKDSRFEKNSFLEKLNALDRSKLEKGVWEGVVLSVFFIILIFSPRIIQWLGNF